MTATPPRAPRSLLPWLLAALATAAVWWHAAVLLPFVISLVLAYVLEPAVARLVRARVPLPLAVGLCLTVLLLLVSVLLVLLVPIVSQLVPMVRAQLPDLLVSLWKGVVPTLQQYGLEPPTSVDEIKAELADLLQSHAADWGGALWKSVLAGGSGLMALAGLALLVPMLAFYWLLDWARLMGQADALLPPRWRVHVHALRDEMDALMGQYLRGQLLVMLILAVYYSVGLSLAGFRLALPIGVFTGLAMFVPYLGFGIGLVVALIAGVLQFASAKALVMVAVVYGAGQVIEGFYFTPRFVGERIGLHPLAVIFALLAFAQLFGFVGVLVALPASAVLLVAIRRARDGYMGSRLYQG